MRQLLLLLTLLAPLVLAEGPEFEVASIKPFTPGPNGFFISLASTGGPGTADPTHLQITTSLQGILLTAFDVKNYQIQIPKTSTSMFEFSAVVPEGATKEDVRTMWKNLLASRFGMVYHIEQREMQVDELVVGPRGHKLIENKDPEPSPADPVSGPPAPMKFDSAGLPLLERPGLVRMMRTSPTGVKGQIVARMQNSAAIAAMMANDLQHPVIDKTGLTGKYDFSIEYLPGPQSAAPGGTAPQAPELGLTASDAIQQELGLRLIKGKGMVDIIVIDNLNATPTEN